MLETNVVMESFVVFGRWIRKTLRNPSFLFFSLIQPVVWFVLFTQAFASIADIRTPIPGSPGLFYTFKDFTGTDSYLTFFSAAVIIQTVIASAMQSGMGMVTDLESGFLDKMRVAPIHRSSILTGKVMSDGFRIVVQTLVILILAYALGVRIASGVPGLLIILLIAAAFGMAWSGISLFIALVTKNSETTLMISILTTFPLLFLSTAVMPTQLLPSWVQSVAKYNPISYIADGLHSLVISGFNWATLGYAFLVIAAVGALTLAATSAVFRRAVSA